MHRFALALGVFVLAASSSHAEVYLSCNVRAVGTWGDRVHVLCNEPYGGTAISYFATPASDRAMAARMESIGLVAQVTGTPARIYFDLGDTSGASFGCATSDCRVIDGIEVLGLGPLVASNGGAGGASLAAITVPEPGTSTAALAAAAGLTTLRRRRRP